MLKLVCIGVLSEDFSDIFDFFRVLAISHLRSQLDKHAHKVRVLLIESNNCQKFPLNVSLVLRMLLDSENQLKCIL